MDDKQPKKDNFGPEGDELWTTCSEALARVGELRESIAQVKGPRSESDTLNPLNLIDIELDQVLGSCDLLESVHPDPGVRRAAARGRQAGMGLVSELELDRTLYEAVIPFEERLSSLAPETARFIEHTLLDFRRAGVDQDTPIRERLKHLQEELVKIRQEFNLNLRDDTRSILVDATDDLAGLPDDYTAARPPDLQGKVRITTNYPDLIPFMTYAKNGTRRRELLFEHNNRAFPKNTGLLKQMLELRHEIAVLLGRPTWGAYAVEDKMAKEVAVVRTFIRRVNKIAAPQSAMDLSLLLQRKREDDPGADQIGEWERAYYGELVRAENLQFDSQEIRPFLEINRVKQGVLHVAERLFGLSFRQVNEASWHQSVETYEVIDNNERIGRFHLDLYPREGKYKHAAMFPIRSGVAGVQEPAAALVCNFPDPSTSSGPALLEHSDVVTLFHELGHLLHHILGGAQRYARFSGVSTEWDFVEVPSQLLEEWAWNQEALASFAVHWETGEPIPAGLVERMNRARTFGRGISLRQQVFYAELSLVLHEKEPGGLDVRTVVDDLSAHYSPFTRLEGTHMETSFGHLEGYSSLYYTYLWSQVIALDLLAEQQRAGMFDKDEASRYRREILEPGGSRDARELVRAYLGRDYDLDAFQRWVDQGACAGQEIGDQP